MKKFGLHWFRRDLRVAGNPALQRQFSLYEGRVVCLFCFDKEFLNRPDFSINRFQFFLETLDALKQELRQIGSDLLVLDTGPKEAFKQLFDGLKNSSTLECLDLISFCRDYEPFACQRDDQMTTFFEDHSLSVETFRDHLIIEPDELTKDDGEGYKVYTPFSRKWMELIENDQFQSRINSQVTSIEYYKKKKFNRKLFQLSWNDVLKNKYFLEDVLKQYIEDNSKFVDIPIPPAGSLHAWKSLEEFCSKIQAYGQKRDFPAQEATSKFSLYLKNGSLTTAQIYYYLKLKTYKKKQLSQDVFLSEIIWREFYYHLLWRHPRVEQEAFLTQYKDLKWANDKEKFQIWCEGKTGFPIVDAGMRQLNQTGWMHNRVRMIVASFLTKDLLIDWKWGEQYFMEKLLDGDVAANNGGWQWAASTGCDAQPYFRIFNPWTQSKRFDPEGVYIKKYLPQLKEYPAKSLHKPILDCEAYPAPIVDHSAQRNKALAMYKINKK
ncbi:MAG: deoxyribodipyrimidine photo-lyase [Bacteriovoracaceae bacterium]|jgi:deoxyribodipyrimidine photo-lyase|nr:hypothetical protein [Halobacteriovoraceae bacterium]MDP7321177.1 deoxyribodipyrimidine photo-lyase [Bacteriovoracaceae bacterium]